MKNNFYLFVFVLTILAFTTSCSKHSSITSITASPAQREALLGGRLEKFTKDISWGSVGRASQFVEKGSKIAFSKIASRRSEKENVVEVKIQNVDFKDESNLAEVVMETQFFSKPSLYVDSRFEQQLWAYDRLEGGWLLRNSKVIDKEEMQKILNSIEDSF